MSKQVIVVNSVKNEVRVKNELPPDMKEYVRRALRNLMDAKSALFDGHDDTKTSSKEKALYNKAEDDVYNAIQALRSIV